MEKVNFKKWCQEHRWTPSLLSVEFRKYGVRISTSTIWYWVNGIYAPGNEKFRDVLTEITKVPADDFFGEISIPFQPKQK